MQGSAPRLGLSGIAYLTLVGCVFDLGELVPSNAGAGNETGSAGGTSAGGGGTQQGGASSGGSAGDSPSACGPGEKFCGGSCRPISPAVGCSTESCEPCLAPPQTLLACSSTSGACIFSGCQPGFADCNGDVSADVGSTQGDGCEYSFGTISDTPDRLEVPFAKIELDHERNDWDGVPAYGFDEVCIDCKDDALPAVLEQAEKPNTRDLQAYFRVAWDKNFFYVLLDAFDDAPFAEGSVEGNCAGGGQCEDSVSVFFDGRGDGGGSYGNDNSRVFAGLSQRFHAPSQGQPASSDVSVSSTLVGNACYRIEARFRWSYVVFNTGGGTAPGQFPPAANQSYGFDISVNDWDPSLSSGQFERQSEVFWIAPGKNYGFNSTGIGSMTLSGGEADAGAP